VAGRKGFNIKRPPIEPQPSWPKLPAPLPTSADRFQRPLYLFCTLGTDYPATTPFMLRATPASERRSYRIALPPIGEMCMVLRAKEY